MNDRIVRVEALVVSRVFAKYLLGPRVVDYVLSLV